MKKFLSFSLTVLFGIAVFLFIITFSIGLPIYNRLFYYLQIEPLGLPEITGYDAETIKAAYNQVLDYLTLPNKPFGVGVFKYTQDGAAHFADCKALFNLNIVVMIISAVIIVTTLILQKLNIVQLKRPFGYSVAFISAISIFAVILIIVLLAASDFNRAFIVFHEIFFAGKDNWTFDPRYDEIVKVLPETFFMNCAIFIGVGIIVLSLGIIIFQIIKKKRSNNKKFSKNGEFTQNN